jgi:GT2 family glycosyltransferase
VLVEEERKGLSYARNAGIAVSRGEIVVATDDDVTMPRDWLEKLVASFSRSDVMVVTGNVLPFELETEAQIFFEAYGGLGRGFHRREVGPEWFRSGRRSVATWSLGGTANAAFRSGIFSNPGIGMINETLGAGTPTGCSEDTYIFYKVLKAGHVIVYEPDAYVWHKHRRDTSVFRQQIYNYSKGHVAYHLTTLFRDHDLRALLRLGFELPVATVKRIKARLGGKSIYPVHLILWELLGSFVGLFSLLESWYRVKRLGRSSKRIPPEQRTPVV